MPKEYDSVWFIPDEIRELYTYVAHHKYTSHRVERWTRKLTNGMSEIGYSENSKVWFALFNDGHTFYQLGDGLTFMDAHNILEAYISLSEDDEYVPEEMMERL